MRKRNVIYRIDRTEKPVNAGRETTKTKTGFGSFDESFENGHVLAERTVLERGVGLELG
jgi:hypothetical protein